MIAPNLATMLAFIATSAPMSRAALQAELCEACDASFNMISVDGDMSTNDAVYAFAPPGDGAPPAGFGDALRTVTRELAYAMVRDGEGATKTLTVDVTAARDAAQARAIARAVINSSLVKTALYGEDPNWGRIISAAGAARVGTRSRHAGRSTSTTSCGSTAARSRCSLKPKRTTNSKARAVRVRLDLGIGDVCATAWGCDLSRDYVRINAHYRT